MRVLAPLLPAVLALLAAAYSPLLVDLSPRPELTLVAALVGAGLVALGVWRRRSALVWAGQGLLWMLVAASLASQVAPFGTAPGRTWGPRGLVLVAALTVWAVLLQPPVWVALGARVTGLVTLLALGILWVSAPAVAATVSFNWLAVDSAGTLYGTETDFGVIWALGATPASLLPRHASAGHPGPGYQPAGSDATLAQAAAGGRAASLPDKTLVFCGLALDAQGRLYMLDPDLREVRQFSPDGLLRRAWALPGTAPPSQGCLAADAERVYAADQAGTIYVFDQAGQLQTQWARDEEPVALAARTPAASGQLLVLYKQRVVALQSPGGELAQEWQLPAPTGGLLPPGRGPLTPYRAVAAGREGDVWVSDAQLKRVRHLGRDNRELAPLGKPGAWPGQFAGAGGYVGELAEPGGLALDRQGNLYVSDTAYRVIQRFRPDGRVDRLYTVAEDEALPLR